MVFFVFFCDEESKRKEINRTLVRDDVKFSFSIISSYFKSSPTYSYVNLQVVRATCCPPSTDDTLNDGADY